LVGGLERVLNSTATSATRASAHSTIPIYELEFTGLCDLPAVDETDEELSCFLTQSLSQAELHLPGTENRFFAAVKRQRRPTAVAENTDLSVEDLKTRRSSRRFAKSNGSTSSAMRPPAS
jgi:hypothetical protein